MPNFTFLHAADIHLDSPLAGLSRYDGVPADDIRRAPRAAFDQLIREAIERRVDFVIIAGDLYDGDWKDMGTGLYFSAAMGRLARAGIPVFLLAGNHDAASVITRALPVPEGVITFAHKRAQTHLIPHLSVAIHGRSFADRAVTENLAAAYPDPVAGHFNIGVLHTALAGHAEHEPYAPCTVDELIARGYDYWALGHVHEYACVALAPPVVFPGNIQGRSIRETGPRGAVIVTVEDGEPRVERLFLDVVRWTAAEVVATPHESLDALHAAIRAVLRSTWDEESADRPLIVRLSITGATPLHFSLQDRAATLRDDTRALAAEISPLLWLEKLRLRTQAPTRQTRDDTETARLIPEPDDALRAALAADFAKFLATVPPQEEASLVRQAAAGNWDAIIETARDALRARLAT